jgi:hypothetical protein
MHLGRLEPRIDRSVDHDEVAVAPELVEEGAEVWEGQ